MTIQNNPKILTRLVISFLFCLFLTIAREARCEISANQIGETCLDALKEEAKYLYLDRISPIQNDSSQKELILVTGGLAGSGDTSLIVLLRTLNTCRVVLSTDGRGVSIDKTYTNGYPNIETYHSEGKDEETGALLTEDVTYSWNGNEYEDITPRDRMKQAEKSTNERQETNYYRGTIGKHSITMRLAINAGNITGEYIYDNKGINIDIKGKKVGNKLEMSEFYEGQKTGIFVGRYDPQSKRVAGEWRKSNQNPPIPFMLDVVLLGSTGFPQVTVRNSSNNQTLQLFLIKSMAEEYGPVANDANEITYDIAYQSEDLVSILFTYTYEGGAHSNIVYRSLNISLISGRAKRINLESLFKNKSNYVGILSKLCIADLKRRDAELYKDKLSKHELDVFNLTSDSINFAFAPYVAGSYAAGSYFISIPYKSMINIIDPQGPLGSYTGVPH